MLRTIAVAAMLLLPQSMLAEDLAWEKDWKEAFRIARTQHKPVFVDFYADWCGPCRMMESSVFPAPQVQERLREYVLLRLDVERGLPPGVKVNVRGLPTYQIYDFAEQERFTFLGGMQAEHFIKILDLAREATPFILRAAELFQDKNDLQAWTELAKGYGRARLSERSRDAWAKSRRVAESQGDAETAQIAAINGAFTWVLDGQAAQAVKILKNIATTPVNKDTEALCWFTMAQAHVLAGNTAEARTAFEKTRTLVAEDHALAKQAAAALSQLDR